MSRRWTLPSIKTLGDVTEEVAAPLMDRPAGRAWWIAVILSALVALALSVPGMVSAWWVRWTPVTLLGMWGSVLLFEVLSSGTSLIPARAGAGCLWKTYGIAVGPAAVLVWLAGRAAPLDWRWTGSLAALAALSFGVLGTELICPITGHGHLFTWHFLPVATMTVAAFAGAALVTRLR